MSLLKGSATASDDATLNSSAPELRSTLTVPLPQINHRVVWTALTHTPEKGGPGKQQQQQQEQQQQKRQRHRQLPRIDQGHGRLQREEALCHKWIVSHRQEQNAAVVVVEVARELFYDVVIRRYQFAPESGHDQMRLLAVRAAVSCFLLEEIVRSLPRHEVLLPCVGIILRSVYVADTAEIRAALGGTIAYPKLLDDIAPNTAARDLLGRYARKTYFIAHHELTQKVIRCAHANAARRQHFRRLPRIFSLLNNNWIKSFLRIIMKAWRRVCTSRRESEQKLRARWAQRFAAARIRSGVRQWRIFATYRLQRAAAAESIQLQIKTINESIQGLNEEISVLSTESANLSAQLTTNENLRVMVEKQIAERELEYQEKLEQVREMDRVGSQLLESLLLQAPFPHGGEAMPPLELLIFWANSTLLGSVFGTFFISPSDDDFAEFVNNIKKNPGGKLVSLTVSDVPEESLPFNALMTESVTVYVPFYRFMALLRVMDHELGPTREDIKVMSSGDAKARKQRSDLEDAECASGVVPDEVTTLAELETSLATSLVEAYQRLTGGESLVTAAQLASRRRGVQLVFLAGLMHYFANWMESKVKKQKGLQSSRRNTLEGSDENDDEDKDDDNENETINNTPVFLERYRGVRHERFMEWYHPPKNHLEWVKLVANQRRWIAASLSALHRAVTVALEPHPVLSREEEESIPLFMENVTLTRITDILPKEAMNTSSFFLRLVRYVENVFPKLRALFQLYAVPSSNGTTSYVTALDFWRLLHDCHIVGSRDKLHRVAVRRILACVSEDVTAGSPTGRNPRSEPATTGKNGRRSRVARDNAEIDLKLAHYKIHLSAPEFMEALLRCAQVWDGMRQREQWQEGRRTPTPSPIPSPKEGKKKRRGTDTETETETMAKQANSSFSASTTSATGGKGFAASRTDGDMAGDYISYQWCDLYWTLRPAAVWEFFHEWLLPHGFRGPILHNFRRHARHPELRLFIHTQLEPLFGLFSGYARPKEAYGIRMLHAAEKGEKHETVLTTTDVGIARVLTRHGVQRMARDFDWWKIRRLTTKVIIETFMATIVDVDREPGVLFFPEWIDFLYALVFYYDPNPLRPFHEKALEFISEFVLKFYKGDD